MTNRELEQMLRKATSDKVFELLRLISGDREPYTMNGWNGSGPIIFEAQGRRVSVEITIEESTHA